MSISLCFEYYTDGGEICQLKKCAFMEWNLGRGEKPGPERVAVWKELCYYDDNNFGKAVTEYRMLD